jgi:peptidoglycan/LPS O-acetylase OafA/YrhL
LKFLIKSYNKLFAEITTIPRGLQDSYFPVLDGFRAVAILIVVFTHVGINKYLMPYGLNMDSTTGVHIFFVISGFLITTLLLKEKIKNGRISLKYFYIRRALRILPLAYLFLLILIVLNSIYHLKIPTADFLASFLFYKNLPMPNEPFTAHFWSLAVEEQFYITFPLLLAYNTNKYMAFALGIVIIVPAISILNYYNIGPWPQTGILHSISKVCMYAFWKGPVIILIGSLFSLCLFKGIIKPEFIKINYFTSFIILLVGITITSKGFIFYSKYISEYVSALLVGFAIILSINKPGLLSTILSNAFFRWIGILSYSIYIWQELLIGSRAWQPWMHVFYSYPLWVVIIIKIVLITIIATTAYKFERFFLKIKNRYTFNNKWMQVH